MLLLFAACSAPPKEVALGVANAFVAGDVETIRAAIDPAYADPLGGAETLFADLETLVETHPRRTLTLSDLSTSQDTSKLVSTVTGRLDVELVGAPTWRVTGPAQFAFARTDRFRIRSGLLAHVRDIRGLMAGRRAALEANDAVQFRALLHPRYKDGDLDVDDAVERFAKDTKGVAIRLQPTNYRVELRGPIAHVDEHYLLKVGERTLPPSVARFTLQRAAGRWKIAAGLYPAHE